MTRAAFAGMLLLSLAGPAAAQSRSETPVLAGFREARKARSAIPPRNTAHGMTIPAWRQRLINRRRKGRTK